MKETKSKSNKLRKSLIACVSFRR